MINFESMKRRMQALFTTGLLKNYNERPPDKDGRPSLPEIQFEGMDGETRDKRENITPYGFAHWPRPDTAEALLFAENGEKAHTVALCIADRWFRLKLNEKGEVAIYDDQDQWVWLKRDGIEIKGKKLVIDCDVEIKGDASIKGDVSISDDLKVKGFNVH